MQVFICLFVCLHIERAHLSQKHIPPDSELAEIPQISFTWSIFNPLNATGSFADSPKKPVIYSLGQTMEVGFVGENTSSLKKTTS